MDIKNLKCWIDKDGNTVYGNEKKYNKLLEYLISTNPEDTISKRGIKLRKLFHPLYIKALPLTSKNKFEILNREELPKDRKVVFIANHGFRDDIALSMITAKDRHSYFVFASIPDFFFSLDGYALWANGIFLMDRRDKESKAALLPKVDYAFKNGLDSVIICPEGVWNKDPNEMILDLWKGAYEIAKKHNALIVPISNYNRDMKIDGDVYKGKKGICYSTMGKPIEPLAQSEEETIRLMRDSLATDRYELMDKYGHASRARFASPKDEHYIDYSIDERITPEEYWDEYIREMVNTTGVIKGCTIVDKDGNKRIDSSRLYDYSVENSSEFIDKNKPSEYEVFEPITRLEENGKTARILKEAKKIKAKKKEYF